MGYSLPTNEVSAQNQLALVKIYVQKSNYGARAVRIDEIKALSPVKSDRISKCHRFLVDFGLLIKKGHTYQPSEEAIKISEYFAGGDDYAAQKSLREIISTTWFGKFVDEFLKLVGSANRESLVERLLIAAKAPAIELNREKAGVLIDWLLMAGYIQRNTNGSFSLYKAPESQDGGTPDSPVEPRISDINVNGRDIKINLTLEVSLSELNPELRAEVINLIKQKLI